MPTAMETTMKDQPDAQTLTMPDAQTVTEVKHYTDRLFSFRVTRPRSLRFRSGEFVMIGLPGDDGKPILRAYSIASPAWDEELEFYSIKVQDGPLTSRLQHIQPGDQIILKTKAVGTLVLDALLPGKHLWFFATGTGIAPFASLIRDPDTYERYDRVILAHTTRLAAELTYGHELLQRTFDDPLVGEMAAEKLTYFPATTREDYPEMGRITHKLESGELFEKLGVDPITPAADRAMVCGSMDLNRDMMKILDGYGLNEGANSDPREYVVERAFVG
jgi:ferredoxin--NADP+ reductase